MKKEVKEAKITKKEPVESQSKPEQTKPKIVKLPSKPVEKPPPPPVSKLQLALAETKEDEGKPVMKKKKRFAISGYQAAGESSTEVSSESIVADPVPTPAPPKDEVKKVELITPMDMFPIPFKKTSNSIGDGIPSKTIQDQKVSAEKAAKILEAEKKNCLPLCAYIKLESTRSSYFKPTNITRENLWGSHPKEHHTKVFLDLQIAFCLGLQSGRQLLEKYPKIEARVATTQEKTALEATEISSRLLKTMLLTMDPAWIQTTKVNGIDSLKLAEIDLHIVYWNQELYRILSEHATQVESQLGTQLNWIRDLTWPISADESQKEEPQSATIAKAYVHKLKRFKMGQ